ncbi:hypothetical protein AHIS2_p074 [Acaryochloris phage A-HIS2]|nr:hypothetical protein AHIS2_p074 [Acaryochloris phage A-HIS2]
MKTEKAKSISEVIKEVFVSIASIIIVLGSVAQGLTSFFPGETAPKTNVKGKMDPYLRSYLMDAPRAYFGVAVWSFSPDLSYRGLLGYHSVKPLNTTGIAMRSTREPGFKDSLEILKAEKCHTVLTQDLPLGDSERSLMETYNVLGVMRCPVVHSGKLIGMVSGSWVDSKVDLDKLRSRLLRLSGIVERYLTTENPRSSPMP